MAGRPPNPIPHTHLKLSLPTPLVEKLKAMFHSDVEGRVPYGRLQEFFIRIIQEELAAQHLDLGPYLGSLPTEHVVRARPHTVEALKTHLERKIA